MSQSGIVCICYYESIFIFTAHKRSHLVSLAVIFYTQQQQQQQQQQQ
jgi:hypothetical protein